MRPAAEPRSPIRHEVLRLARPAIAQSLLQTLTFVVDRAMLGHHAGDSLAALQIGGSLGWGLFIVASAFTAGTVATVGRAIGARDPDAARAAARGTLGIALTASIIGAALGAVGAWLAPLAFPAAGPAIVRGAQGYLAATLPGLPILLSAVALSTIYQASGDTRVPFLAGAVGNALNLAFDWLLIFGHMGAPELGPVGAGVGTSMSWVGQVLVLVLLLRWSWRVPRLRGRGGEGAAIRRILRITWPALGERAVQALGYFVYVWMIGALGGTAMAAHQALLALEAIAWLSADGFGIAAGTVVAQRLGARAPDEARRGGWTATGFAIVALSAVGLVFLTIPSALLAAFSPDPALVAAATPSLRVAGAAQPFMAVAVVLSAALRAAGATGAVFAVAFLGGFGVRLAVTAVAAFGLDLGLLGVWLGSTADWIVRAAVLAALFTGSAWQRR